MQQAGDEWRLYASWERNWASACYNVKNIIYNSHLNFSLQLRISPDCQYSTYCNTRDHVATYRLAREDHCIFDFFKSFFLNSRPTQTIVDFCYFTQAFLDLHHHLLISLWINRIESILNLDLHASSWAWHISLFFIFDKSCACMHVVWFLPSHNATLSVEVYELADSTLVSTIWQEIDRHCRNHCIVSTFFHARDIISIVACDLHVDIILTYF